MRKSFNRIPGATYRLQFHAGFTLEHASALLDYLHALGITDVYASPLFEAGPGSTHGYDTCSHTKISACLGGADALRALADGLRARGMGLLLDIVPNHMGTHASNDWWWNVLAHGRASPFAHFFDIDWERGGGKVLLPVLGNPLPEVIQAGELKWIEKNGEPRIAYYDNEFPVAPNTSNEFRRAPAKEAEWVRLLDSQHYRLAHWRIGPEEINYRRFFDITGLVAMRMEEAFVFETTHESLLELLRAGSVTGLRVDHPDGLRDPRQYFERLQQAAEGDGLCYVVAEKILSGQEQLPRDWPVAGTTGYDFLVQLNALFVARQNEAAMTDLYREFTGCSETFHAVAVRSKKRVLELSFPGDVESLAKRLGALAGTTVESAKLSQSELRDAIIEVIAHLDVYRTYVTESSEQLSAADAEIIDRAVASAKRDAPPLAVAIDFLASILRMSSFRNDAREFILKFQQLSGPAAAKGIEDTAFYNYFRLTSLNEVGGEPGDFGNDVAEFHRRTQHRAEHWPHSLLATATHDTKRGEDTRARINVLSEMPEKWRAAVFRWRDWNSHFKTVVGGNPAPDGNDEYLLYQTLVGSWTAEGSTNQFRQRLVHYMLKAIKESKRRTSWTDPDQDYEQATQRFVEAVLAPANGEFLGDFVELQREVAFFGVFNTLAQTLIKATAPGVPDIYQGSELWDLSLVDPDNRRPVDFDLRRRLLDEIQAGDRAHLRADASHGAIKLFLIQRALVFRNQNRPVFDAGSYLPLQMIGAKHEHVCAFARISPEGTVALTVVPRLVRTLMNGTTRMPLGEEVWTDTRVLLPTELSSVREWRNVLTDENFAGGESLRLSDVLPSFPVALLTQS